MSSPTEVALIFILPDFKIVPPIKSSSISFSTGMLSPVSMDSSTKAEPQTTFPSTGILSPIFTIKMSFTFISSKGTSSISPFTSLLAKPVFIAANSLIAVVVCFTDLCSNTFPKSTKVIIVAVVSKNK